jgi:hypothetical protein
MSKNQHLCSDMHAFSIVALAEEHAAMQWARKSLQDIMTVVASAWHQGGEKTHLDENLAPSL